MLFFHQYPELNFQLAFNLVIYSINVPLSTSVNPVNPVNPLVNLVNLLNRQLCQPPFHIFVNPVNLFVYLCQLHPHACGHDAPAPSEGRPPD